MIKDNSNFNFISQINKKGPKLPILSQGISNLNKKFDYVGKQENSLKWNLENPIPLSINSSTSSLIKSP